MRPEHLEKSGMSAEETTTFLDALAAVVEPVKLRFLWRPSLKDAVDEMVLEAAVNGRADYLATFNLRHLEAAAMKFGIRARRPRDVLREIRGGKDEKK